MASLLIIVLLAAFQLSAAVYLTSDSYKPCSYDNTGPVQILDCSNKGLTEVPGVDPSMIVSVFYLTGNPIASIEQKAFVNISRTLTLLSIESSILMERIENLAFDSLTSLKTLTVNAMAGSQNSMNKVNIGTMISGLWSLSSLTMRNINIKELPIAFAGGTSLTSLSLTQTAIATINQFAFSNASKLRILDLSNNPLSTTEGKMSWLSSAVSLEAGKFGSCRITTAYFDQMPSLPKLKKLDLSSNSIDRIEANSLDNVKSSLEELVLSNNPISESSTQGLANLIALKKLTMLNNPKLSAIPPEVRHLQALELLDLRGTKIIGVEATNFHPNSQLRTLKLDETKVQSLHARAFSVLRNLEELTLSTGGLNTATILDMAGNTHRGNWTIILAQLPRLQNLTLSGIGNDVDTTGGLTNSIWSAVQQLSGLRRLNLDYNSVTAVPDFYTAFFVNLSFVSLQSNKIERLTSATFYGADSSVRLMLQDNSLSLIDNCTLTMFSNLSRVNLMGNPFTCNCAMQWLWQRVKSESQINLPSMTCTQPAALAGRTWDTLSAPDFCKSGEVPPNNCSVQVPTSVPPTSTPTPSLLLNITVSKASAISVRLNANFSQLTGRISAYIVKYWPVSRPEAAHNTTPLPTSVSSITVQIGTNELYRFCYALIINGTSLPVELQSNCRDYTLNGMASAAVIAIGILAAIIGIALVFAAVCLLCKKLRNREAKGQATEEDPYIYTYPDEKQIGKQTVPRSCNGSSQFQATLRPESKRYSKRSRTNLASSRPSLATSTTTLVTSRMSSPGFAIQNGARPVSGQLIQQHQNPLLLSGSGMVQPSRSMHSIADNRAMGDTFQQSMMSRSQDQLTEAPTNRRSGRMLPPPPRHTQSQELVLDVTRVMSPQADGRYLHQQSSQGPPPLLPPPRQRLAYAGQIQSQQQIIPPASNHSDRGGYTDGAYVPMSAVSYPDAGESSTDDFRQPQQTATYNAYLPEDQLGEAMRNPATAQQVLSPQGERVSGGVDNSAFQRNDTSGYYEMGQF